MPQKSNDPGNTGRASVPQEQEDELEMAEEDDAFEEDEDDASSELEEDDVEE